MNNQQCRNIIESPVFDGAVPSELSADYILPDIYPDVKRILRISARPIIIDRFVSGHRLEFSGAVDYCVIFSYENDGIEGIRSVHFSADYSSILGELDGLEAADISITPRTEVLNAKLANPRKLTIRSVIVCDVKITTPISCTDVLIGNAAKKASVERLTKELDTCCRRSFITDPLHITESFELDSAFPSVDEIIFSDADIHINDVRPVSGNYFAPMLNGFANVKLILKPMTEEGDYRSFTKKLPLSFNVSAEDFASTMTECKPESITASAWAVPVEINADIAENESGERRIVNLDISADVGVQLFGVIDSVFTSDAYSPCCDWNCEFCEHDAILPMKVLNANFSVGENVKREDMKLPEGDYNIVNTDIVIDSPRLETNNSRRILTATASVSVILQNKDGNFTTAETVIPVRFEPGTGDISEFAAMQCRMCPSDIRTRIDSDKLCFDFEVSVRCEIGERRKLRAVSVIELNSRENTQNNNSAMTVCYRNAGETLWDIAKRYSTTVSAIESANKELGSVIMIPQIKA